MRRADGQSLVNRRRCGPAAPRLDQRDRPVGRCERLRRQKRSGRRIECEQLHDAFGLGHCIQPILEAAGRAKEVGPGQRQVERVATIAAANLPNEPPGSQVVGLKRVALELAAAVAFDVQVFAVVRRHLGQHEAAAVGHDVRVAAVRGDAGEHAVAVQMLSDRRPVVVVGREDAFAVIVGPPRDGFDPFQRRRERVVQADRPALPRRQFGGVEPFEVTPNEPPVRLDRLGDRKARLPRRLQADLDIADCLADLGPQDRLLLPERDRHDIDATAAGPAETLRCWVEVWNRQSAPIEVRRRIVRLRQSGVDVLGEAIQFRPASRAEYIFKRPQSLDRTAGDVRSPRVELRPCPLRAGGVAGFVEREPFDDAPKIAWVRTSRCALKLRGRRGPSRFRGRVAGLRRQVGEQLPSPPTGGPRLTGTVVPKGGVGLAGQQVVEGAGRIFAPPLLDGVADAFELPLDRGGCGQAVVGRVGRTHARLRPFGLRHRDGALARVRVLLAVAEPLPQTLKQVVAAGVPRPDRRCEQDRDDRKQERRTSEATSRRAGRTKRSGVGRRRRHAGDPAAGAKHHGRRPRPRMILFGGGSPFIGGSVDAVGSPREALQFAATGDSVRDPRNRDAAAGLHRLAAWQTQTLCTGEALLRPGRSPRPPFDFFLTSNASIAIRRTG